MNASENRSRIRQRSRVVGQQIRGKPEPEIVDVGGCSVGPTDLVRPLVDDLGAQALQHRQGPGERDDGSPVT